MEGGNDRRDFLNALMAAALMRIVALENVNAQETPNDGQSAGSGRRALRQPLPAPFTSMDAAFAALTIRPGAPPSRPHTHSGFVLGYVIEGDYLFAINNETPRLVPSLDLRGPDNSPVELVRPGRPRAVLFTATWCESYLKDTEPKTVEACRRAREQADELSQNGSVEWLGVVTRLWTTPKGLALYQKRMNPRVQMAVDSEGQAFHVFGIQGFPAVALIDADGRLFRIVGPEDNDLTTGIGELAARHKK